MNMQNITLQRLLNRLVIVVCIASLLILPVPAPSLAQADLHSYIVMGSSTADVARVVRQVGGQVTSDLDIISGVSALLTLEKVAQLQQQKGIRSVTANAEVNSVGGGDKGGGKADEEVGKDGKSPATDYPDVVGADVTWSRKVNGTGVAVALLDTGIGRHSGLLRGVDGQTGRVVGWVDLIEKYPQPHDPNGHGSHVAGVIANSQTGTDNEWNGVAPGVNLVGVRVLDEKGTGTYEKVIQGIQWVIERKNQLNIRVMNLSIVANVQSPYWADPLNIAIMQAWSHGITVVVAAGNGGPKPMTIGVPGNNPYVVTVGAFTDNYTPNKWGDDYIAPFSAAGPTLDAFAKPDVVAPGAHMVSTMLPSTYIAKNHEASKVDNGYFSMAGTSQSTAVVSGIAALAIAKNPALTPNEVKYRIMATAFPWVDAKTNDAIYSLWQQGAGRVNAPGAVFADIKGKANLGMDIRADIAGTSHYEGFTYYDAASGTFKLRGEFEVLQGKYSNWNGSYGQWTGAFTTWVGKEGAWSGNFATWTGKEGAWSGKEGAWSGKEGAWSGKEGAWSGKEGAWSGKEGAWSGAYSAWDGAYTTWSGGYNTWSGNHLWTGIYTQPAFIKNYLDGKPASTVSITFAPVWVEER